MELLEGGLDIIYVSKLLGHEDLETTASNTHPSQLAAIERASRIDLFATRRKGSPRRGGVQSRAELEGMDRWGFEPQASSMPRKRSTSDLPALCSMGKSASPVL